jgi:DNA-binding HxlR family transcriptional regulator
MARTLEVIGERWTLLIVRDAFYGVRRFGDFVSHLNIPRAVLTERLKSLTENDVLQRVPGSGRRMEYELTAKGIALWPTVRSMLTWGSEYYAPKGPLRIFRHAADDGELDPIGRCASCGQLVGVEDTVATPGPGLPNRASADPVTEALSQPHRLLTPLRS